MPIEYTKGDLLQAPERIIAHGCNAQGVMNSGVAKAVREKYPNAFTVYKTTYDWWNHAQNGLVLGMVIPALCGDKIIANMITQHDYGRDPNIRYVNYDACRTGFSALQMLARHYNEKVVAIPKIGAGLGNGDWNVIEAIIKERCNEINVKVYEL